MLIDYDSWFMRTLYKLYVNDWIHSHVTFEEQQDDIRCFMAEVEDDCHGNGLVAYTYNDFLFENGYMNCGMYASYDEFCNNEFHHRDYIKKLLSDPALYARYEKIEGNWYG